MNIRWLVPALIVLGLAACSSAPKKTATSASGGTRSGTVVAGQGGTAARTRCPQGSPYARAQEDLSTRGNYTAGGLYKPGVKDSTPDYIPNVDCIPEPLVTNEPRSAVGNKSPYSVLGKSYRVMDAADNYVEQGLASYYGQKFHGRLTSNREVYDMYAFTAAHKTLPLPSFARVTNLDNGESITVRVNDRGPFHDGRVIDLSYAAAVRLGITQRGTGRVEVRGLTPGSENPRASSDSRRERRQRAVAAVAAATPAQAATAVASHMDQLVEKLPPAVAAGRAPVLAAAAAEPVVISSPLAPAADPASRALGSVLLQVASFSSRDNAARALGQLVSAGIIGASLNDIVSGGRTLWRLRVPADDAASAAELAGRIAALGFERPQLVRD